MAIAILLHKARQRSLTISAQESNEIAKRKLDRGQILTKLESVPAGILEELRERLSHHVEQKGLE